MGGTQRFRGKQVTVALSTLIVALSSVAWSPVYAAAPSTIAVAGAVRAANLPVADGKYGFKVSLYPDANAPAVWSEVFLAVVVTRGSFALILGETNPISAAFFATATAPHIGVQIDNDPEFARSPLHATPFAMSAAHAHGLTCTGCVKTSSLAFDGDFDLSGKALTADKITAKSLEAGSLVAQSVTAQIVSAKSFAGDGSKLTGIKTPTGKCTTKGHVVVGIAADGQLICAAALDPSSLPADGLSAISNGLLTNTFTEGASIDKPIPVADNNPSGATAVVDVPDFGLAKTLVVRVKVATSSSAQVQLTVVDPAGAKYVLHSNSGTAQTVAGKWPTNKTVSGDLSGWVGKNPKGKWTLQVVDSKFLNNKIDGAIEDFGIEIGTLSTKKVAANGVLMATAGFQFTRAETPPKPCNDANFGYAYADPKSKALLICNGKEWYPINITQVGTQDQPGASCKDIQLKMPAAKSGSYWITLGGPARKVYCDMENNGGGWTLIARMKANSWCHIGANAAGTLTGPTQTACAKLSDAEMRTLYSDQFWLSCGTTTPHRFGRIDNIANFDTTAKIGNKKMTWSQTYNGATYKGTDDKCCNFGDQNYHNPHVIYSIATGYNGGNYKANWSGCYNNKHGWDQSGYLYVR